MNKSLALVLALGLALTTGAAERQKFKHSHIPAAVAKLKPIGDLEATNVFHLSIGLPLRNQVQLDALLKDLYSPSSPNYRHWLDSTQFTERFGPTTNDYEAVVAWAKSNGFTISMRHQNRASLSVDGHTPSIERAFSVKMKKYRHPTEGRNFHSPDREPTIGISVPVLGITGLDNYSIPHHGPGVRNSPVTKAPTPRNGSGPTGSYRGWDFRNAYLPGTPTNSMIGSGQNVGLLQMEDYYPSDISAYQSATGLPSISITRVNVAGGSSPSSGNDEISLDIEMVNSMAPGCNIYLYIAPRDSSSWVPLLSRMASDNICKQISCSWGDTSARPVVASILSQMAAQGQSFFTSSGDLDAYTWSVDFPVYETNVTVVGGTTLTTGTNSSYISETAWNWGLTNGTYYGTGGGYVLDVMPIWQQGISMALNLGSTTNRNYPDISMTADNIWIAYGNGSTGINGGTSASSPLWAALCALINEKAVAAGSNTVGFLNPAIYTIGKSAIYTNCFHDITTGNNFWPSSPSWFPSVPGYDLCTGWGTPNGTNLINALYKGPEIVSLSFSNGLFIGAH